MLQFGKNETTSIFFLKKKLSLVVNENISDKFDNGHRRLKIKVTLGIQSFPIYHNTNC